MKNLTRSIFKTSLMLAITFTIIGCGKPTTPTEVAEAYMNAWINEDLETIIEYSAEPEGFGIVEKMSDKEKKQFLKDMKKMMAKFNDDTKMKFMEEKIDGNNATVVAEDENGKRGNIRLLNIDGKWKVDL